MQQSSGPSHLTRIHQHRTDDQDEEQQTAGKLCCNHSARSKVKLVLPVLIPGLLLLTVVITARVVDSSQNTKTNEHTTQDDGHTTQSTTYSTSEEKNPTKPTAGCQPAECDPGWEAHGGQCYFFSNEKLNWTQSQEECVRMKSHLAIINDEEEQKLLMREIKGRMQQYEDKFWIGLNDRQTEGEWRWADNTPLNKKQKFWMNKEPDNWKGTNNAYPDGEDCVRMGEINFRGNSATGWIDSACKRKFKFICETKACL